MYESNAPLHRVPARHHGLAVASLVLGVLGAIFGLIPLLFWLAFPLAVLALIFGGVGFRHGMGKAGTILGVVALVLGIVGAVIVNDAVNDLDDCLHNSAEC